MLQRILKVATLLAGATSVSAQYYNGGGSSNNGNDFGGGSGYYGYNSNGIYGPAAFGAYTEERRRLVMAHGVLAALCFVIFLPVGGIIIRLGNFRGVWLVHAICQAFGFLSYIAAAGIGIYIARNIGRLNHFHPIIGLVLLGLLFIQPVTGFVHHWLFRKHNRRLVWSYGHIWLGRIIITLGIINVGLGMYLASRLGFARPPLAAWIAYIVVACIMWLAYVICTIVGEIKRSRASQRLALTAKQAPSVPIIDNGTEKPPAQYA